MRRHDRAVTDIHELLAILDRCDICRLAFCDEGQPYVVPVNFGYEWTDNQLRLYFHGAREGRKVDIWRRHPEVCVEMDCDHQLLPADQACDYGMVFSSIIGFGSLHEVIDESERQRGLNLLLSHTAGQKSEWTFDPAVLSCTMVTRMDVREFTGKSRRIDTPIRSAVQEPAVRDVPPAAVSGVSAGSPPSPDPARVGQPAAEPAAQSDADACPPMAAIVAARKESRIHNGDPSSVAMANLDLPDDLEGIRNTPELGERLRQARAASGLSVHQLADEVAASPEQIAAYEKGDLDIPVGRMFAMASRLGVTVDHLLS